MSFIRHRIRSAVLASNGHIMTGSVHNAFTARMLLADRQANGEAGPAECVVRVPRRMLLTNHSIEHWAGFGYTAPHIAAQAWAERKTRA